MHTILYKTKSLAIHIKDASRSPTAIRHNLTICEWLRDILLTLLSIMSMSQNTVTYNLEIAPDNHTKIIDIVYVSRERCEISSKFGTHTKMIITPLSAI